MSKKQAIAFFEEISKNQQLAQEVEKVVKGKNSDEAKAKELLSLAKKHNFIFTQEDAQNAQDALKKPLSTEEMLEVSGGKGGLKSGLMAAAMLLGLGATGATLHSMEASAMKRTLSGKRGISDLTEPTQRMPQPVGGQQQTAPQTVGRVNPRYHVVDAFPELATNLTQNETPPSNDQGAAQSDSQQATRGTPHSRPRTTSGEEQHATRSRKEKKAWAYVEHSKEAAERFGGIVGCSAQFLSTVRGLAGNGYLPNTDWPAVPQFEQTGDGTQNCRYCNAELTTGQSGGDPFCKNPKCIFPWIFRPASTKLQPSQRPVNANSYARWALLPALILDSRHTYINSTGHRGQGSSRELAIETPAEAWAVWQLISQRGPVVNDVGTWPTIVEMMTAHEVDPAILGEVIQLLEGSYENLVKGNGYLRDLVGSEVQQLVEDHNNGWQNFIGAMVERGYGSEEVKKAVTKMINSYYVLNENQPRDSGYTPSPAARAEIKAAHQRFEIAMQKAEDARKTARRQAIEKLQRREELSLEEARVIAPMLKCVKCGKTGAYAYKTGGWVRLQCANNKCRKVISNRPADLLAMLQAAAPETAPVEMVPAEPNEPQMQFEIQPMHINQGEGPTYEITFHWDAAPQMSMQGMNQFNPGQQMMNPNGFEFNFGAQGMNQFNLGQQMRMQNHDDLENTFIEPYQLQTEGPNDFTFNMGHSHAPIHHHLTVYQMDGSQQPVNVQMQNMDQMNGQQQNTQFAQNQQPMNDQSDLTFDQTQILQQNSDHNSDHNFQFDYIGDYVNALNTATQELAQCNNMLTTITDNPLFANVEMVRNVVASAQAVVNRVFARGLQEPANQIILNTLSADDRYLEAAQAFSGQLEIFNNMLEIIQK